MLLTALLQVYVSSNYGSSFTRATIDGGAARSWAAVSYSRDGSTLVAAAASDEGAGGSAALRSVAVRTLGVRAVQRADQQLQQAKRLAKPAANQFQTVWFSTDKGATWASAAPNEAAPSFFMDVALSGDGSKVVAVQRGPSDSPAGGIYTGSVAVSGGGVIVTEAGATITWNHVGTALQQEW